MTNEGASANSRTYTNPVYPHSFPDPYVLKFRGEYFAYCTGLWTDKNIFGVLRSRDLVTWEAIGSAMQPLGENYSLYWAPEVTYSNGKFYLYYSAGSSEDFMEIRVAVSNRPDGGFVDVGKRLTQEDFAIDAHVFSDTGGRQYLFYATDFLKHAYIGTGTVMDEMIDWFTLAGRPRPVTRAAHDWQVYDPHRVEKGGVRWHTVEGPFVLKRKGIYYEMFSGGNWKNPSYGISFATTDDIESDNEWTQFSDGERILPILRTIPDLVIGPGHNSVTRGPNNRELYCVYHQWVGEARTLAIDRMDFAGRRLFINGATHTPQIAPFAASFADFFDGETLDGRWKVKGNWALQDRQAVSSADSECELVYECQTSSFLSEVSLRMIKADYENSAFGIKLGDEVEFMIFPARNQAEFSWKKKGTLRREIFDLPADFAADAFQILRVETDSNWLKISLEGQITRIEKTLDDAIESIALYTRNARAAFSGFALTKGFESCFDRVDADAESSDWKIIACNGACKINDKQLFIESRENIDAVFVKGEFHADYEYAANVRLAESNTVNSSFGFLILRENGEIALRFRIKQSDEMFYISMAEQQSAIPFPESFLPDSYHQFLLLKIADVLSLRLEDKLLAKVTLPAGKTRIAPFCRASTAVFDMVRLTIL